MKRIILSVIALSVCLAAVPPARAASRYQKYTDQKLKFSIDYPGEYEVKNAGSAVVFSSPLKNKRDTFSESLNVVVVGVADYPGTMKSFYLRSKKSLQESMPQMRVSAESMDTLAGKQAFRLEYTAEQNGTVFQFKQVMAGNLGLVYLLTYTALPQAYQEYLPVIDAMMESFSFID